MQAHHRSVRRAKCHLQPVPRRSSLKPDRRWISPPDQPSRLPLPLSGGSIPRIGLPRRHRYHRCSSLCCRCRSCSVTGVLSAVLPTVRPVGANVARVERAFWVEPAPPAALTLEYDAATGDVTGALASGEGHTSTGQVASTGGRTGSLERKSRWGRRRRHRSRSPLG